MFNSALGGMIYVSDVLASVKFYRDVLGFDFSGYWDSEHCVMDWNKEEQPFYAGFNLQGSHFGIHPLDGKRVLGNTTEFYIVVQNADAYWEEVKAKGGACSDLEDTVWGSRLFSIKDPDGHFWGFYHMK